MGQYGLQDKDACMRDCIVTFYGFEHQHAKDVGNGRHINNWTKNDSENYAKGRAAGRIQSEHDAAPRTSCCESAVGKWTDTYWNSAVWHHADHYLYRHLADVGRNIEVRSVVNKSGTAKLHDYQVGQGLILWVANAIPPDYYQVRMVGWLPYDRAWELSDPVTYGNDNVPSETDRQVAQKHLYHPLHTEESALLSADPRRVPDHQGQCVCRACCNLLTHINFPETLADGTVVTVADEKMRKQAQARARAKARKEEQDRRNSAASTT